MQWIAEAIKASTGEDGVLDLEKLDAAIKTEFPKHAVPKDQYNTKSEKLKEAEKTLAKLQEDNKGLSELQTQIDDYKKLAGERDSALKALQTEVKVKDALRAAKAKDIDYVSFKLGKVTEDDLDGLEERIKELQTSNADWFKPTETETPATEPIKGYKPFDTKLKEGKTPPVEAVAAEQFASALGLPQTETAKE